MLLSHTKETSLSKLTSSIIYFLPIVLCCFCLILEISKNSVNEEISYALDELENDNQSERDGFVKFIDQHELGSYSQNINIPANFQINRLNTQPKIALVTTTSGDVESTKLWIRYHEILGVSVFYLFTDGQANHPKVTKEFEKWKGVKVFPRDEKLIYRENHSRAWNESWLASFFNKPCNYELFVMQSLNMEIALEQAHVDKIDWIMHMDTDELFYPGGSLDFNLQQYLASVDPQVDTIVFPNYEALAEHEHIKDPFTEISLFKRNYAHVTSEQYFKNYKTVSKGNPNYFAAYGNGKSAARVQPKLRSNGAHRWFIYDRHPMEITAEQCAILHYVYTKFSDLKGRRDRCDCAPTQEDTARCFMLPFDREAFIASSLYDTEKLREFFRQHLIWQDSDEVFDLMKKGLLVRIYAPQLLTKLFREMPDFGLTPAPPSESKTTVMHSYKMGE